MELSKLLDAMAKRNASDLFIKVGARPSLRIDGKLHSVDQDPISADDAAAIFEKVVTPYARDVFQQDGEADVAHESQGERFRVNVLRQRGQIGMVFRHLSMKIPSLEKLNMPAERLKKLADLPRGIVLVAGVTGCGKSTTLAAMIEHINQTANKHVVTVEDPIEYVFTDKKCMIDQREIGSDTKSFSAALKHCVRQSPDVILIGEMRDRETMEAAISAAETGHLVLSTLHTVNAVQTVERIINFFPPHQYALIRTQLSLTLKGVVSQRLIKRADDTGRIPAVELLISTPFVQELLESGKTRELPEALAKSSHFGTQTFNQSLMSLSERGVITLDDALLASDNPEELNLKIRGISRG